MKRLRVIIVGLLLFVFVPFAGAQEKSGAIIKDLANKISGYIAEGEKKSEEFAEQRQGLNSQYVKKLEEIRASKDVLEQETLKTDMLETRVRLTMGDLQEVKAHRAVISNVVPALRNLRGEVEKIANQGFVDAEKRKQFYTQMADLMGNVVQLNSQLRRLDIDDKTKQDLLRADQNIIALYRRSGHSGEQTLKYAERLDDMTKVLDQAYAQLTVLEGILEQEKTKLKVDSYEGLLKWLMIRITRGTFDLNRISNISSDLLVELQDRQSLYEEAQAYGITDEMLFEDGGEDPTVAGNDEEILNKIKNGKFDFLN